MRTQVTNLDIDATGITDGKVLTASGGGADWESPTGISSGSSFPTSPLANDTYFRNDLGWLCYYDGSRWLTVQEFSIPGLNYSASTTSQQYFHPRTDYDFYATRVAFAGSVSTTNDISNYWTIEILGSDLSQSSTTSLVSFDTSTISADIIHDYGQDFTTHLSANNDYFELSVIKTGSPGSMLYYLSIYYRLVIT